MHLNNIKCQDPLLRTVLNSDFVPLVDPFLAYFSNLPVWDGLTDHIQALSETIQTTNTSFWQVALKRWLIATVACAIQPEIVNQEVLVLSGRQNSGKTTWLNKLLPDALKGYLHMGTIDPSNKDTLIQLSENLMINLDELENLNKSDLGTLKSVITQGLIRIRRPYTQFIENYIRRASFMASVNEPEFLTDLTGNRRYLTFTAMEINNAHNISMDNVFSQAYHILVHGNQDGNKFKYWFDADDMAAINANNEQYLRISHEEELILKYFEVPNAGDQAIYETPTDMMSRINKAEGRTVLNYFQSHKRFGQVLQKLGFKKVSTKTQKPYRVKLRTLSAVTNRLETIHDQTSVNAAINLLEQGNQDAAIKLGVIIQER